MKTIISILALISSILALILAILPTEKIAIIPAVIAFALALAALFLNKQGGKKLIKFTFFVTIVALVLITYKSLFSSESKITDDQDFIEQNDESEKNALEELEDLPEIDNFEETPDSIQ